MLGGERGLRCALLPSTRHVGTRQGAKQGTRKVRDAAAASSRAHTYGRAVTAARPYGRFTRSAFLSLVLWRCFQSRVRTAPRWPLP